MSVVVDLAVGEVRVGNATLRGVGDASAVVPGAVRLADGLVIAPLAFGPRTTACAMHADARRLAVAILALSLRAGEPTFGGTDDGTDDGPAGSTTPVVQALALHLAGARLVGDGPSFADAAAAMSRLFGWGVDQVVDCPAHVVDHLANSALDLGDDGDDGWKSFVLGPGPVGGDDPADVRDRLATDLLRRAVGGMTRGPRPVDEPVGWTTREHAAAATTVRPAEPGLVGIDPPGERAHPLAPVPAAGGRLVPSGGWETDANGPAWSMNGLTPHPRTISPSGGPGRPTVTGVERSAGAVDAEPTVTAPLRTIGDDPGPGPGWSDGVLRPSPHPPMDRAAAPPVAAAGPNWGPVSSSATRRRPAASARDRDPAPVRTVASEMGVAPVAEPAASIADRLAAELEDEADLRGVLRW